MKTSVDEDAKELVSPLKREGMESIGVGSAAQRPPAVCLGNTVKPTEGTPIERASNDVITPSKRCSEVLPSILSKWSALTVLSMTVNFHGTP